MADGPIYKKDESLVNSFNAVSDQDAYKLLTPEQKNWMHRGFVAGRDYEKSLFSDFIADLLRAIKKHKELSNAE